MKSRFGLCVNALHMVLAGVLAGCSGTPEPEAARRPFEPARRLPEEDPEARSKRLALLNSEPPEPQKDAGSHWGGDGMNGQTTIRIDLSEQRAYLYRGGEIAGVARISSGREGLATPTGTFRIIEKEAWHESSQYGNFVDGAGKVVRKDVEAGVDRPPRGARFAGSPMPYFMRLTSGLGMHSGVLPGFAASHGCIRLPPEMAEAFFGAATVGTPVTIEP